MDSTDIVNYGARLRTFKDKLLDKEILKTFLIMLDTNPAIYIRDEVVDDLGIADSCLPMKPSSIDPPDVEEIGLYYSIKLGRILGGEGEPMDMKRARMDVLGYIYNVIETTRELGRHDRFLGRVLSVYYTVENYLKLC